MDIVKKEYMKLSKTAENVGLETSEGKIKYLVTARHPVQALQLGGKNFEAVDSCVYLGS